MKGNGCVGLNNCLSKSASFMKFKPRNAQSTSWSKPTTSNEKEENSSVMLSNSLPAPLNFTISVLVKPTEVSNLVTKQVPSRFQHPEEIKSVSKSKVFSSTHLEKTVDLSLSKNVVKNSKSQSNISVSTGTGAVTFGMTTGYLIVSSSVVTSKPTNQSNAKTATLAMTSTPLKNSTASAVYTGSTALHSSTTAYKTFSLALTKPTTSSKASTTVSHNYSMPTGVGVVLGIISSSIFIGTLTLIYKYCLHFIHLCRFHRLQEIERDENHNEPPTEATVPLQVRAMYV